MYKKYTPKYGNGLYSSTYPADSLHGDEDYVEMETKVKRELREYLKTLSNEEESNSDD